MALTKRKHFQRGRGAVNLTASAKKGVMSGIRNFSHEIVRHSREWY